MRRGAWIWFVLLLAGCSKLLGIKHLGGSDGGDGEDAGGSKPTLTFTGTLRDLSTKAGVANAPITFHWLRGSENTPLATTTTRSDGMFELPVTMPLPLDGYFAVFEGVPDPPYSTISHLVVPVTGDTRVEIVTLTKDELTAFARDAGVTQTPGRSLVVAHVNRNGVPRKDAMVAVVMPSPTDIQICYTNPSTTLPMCGTGGPTKTDDDGLAWLFNVPDTALDFIATEPNGDAYEGGFGNPINVPVYSAPTRGMK